MSDTLVEVCVTFPESLSEERADSIGELLTRIADASPVTPLAIFTTFGDVLEVEASGGEGEAERAHWASTILKVVETEVSR